MYYDIFIEQQIWVYFYSKWAKTQFLGYVDVGYLLVQWEVYLFIVA